MPPPPPLPPPRRAPGGPLAAPKTTSGDRDLTTKPEGGPAAVEGPPSAPAAPVAEDVPAPAGAGRPRSRMMLLGKNFSWITASQFLTAGGNLVLTPFVIHGLGVERYGLYVLAGTITSYIGSFNGGLLGAAGRYFPVYAGADDREATTRLLVTFSLLVLGLGAIVSGTDWVVSPFIVDALSMRAALRPEALFLFRVMGLLITFSLLHSLVQAVVTARQRFDRAIQAGFICYGLWVLGMVVVVTYHLGLRGVAVVFLAQQAAAVAVILPTAMRYLVRSGLRLLPRREVREMWSFSAKLQVTSWANLVNSSIDTMMVGTALSVRTVGFYNSGNSFANQVNSVASNVTAPAGVEIGNTYGREGPERAFRQFERAQQLWLAGVTGWTAVGAAAGYFAVTAWLGSSFALGGWVAVIALGGSLFTLNVSLLNSYVRTVRNADLELRYGVVQMVANLGLTIPMAFIGALPVAVGAAAASIISADYLVRACRRHLRPDIPGIWREMPAMRAAVAGAVTVALEWLVRPVVVTGPLGLLECVPPALVGLSVFGLLLLGPRRCAQALSSLVRDRRVPRELLEGALAPRRA